MVLGRSTGGIGTHVAQLTGELRRLGDEVALVTDPSTAARFDLTDARTWWPRRRAPVASAAHLLRLRRLVASADVVHVHGYQAGLLGSLVAAGTGTPLVVSLHNDLPRSSGSSGVGGALAGLVMRVIARRAALMTGASPDLVDQARAAGARDVRLAAVPSPRVPALLAQAAPSDAQRAAVRASLLGDAVPEAADRPLVLVLSRIAPQKRLDVAVAAATLLDAMLLAATNAARPSASPLWVVVGDGDQALLGELRAEAQRAGAPVRFLPAVADPTPWLRAADVLVLTSRWEARALVVQEALAAGTPVVASDVPGLRDLLDGVGSLVPVGDVEAVAGAVAAVLRDPASRQTMVTAGRRRATSWDDGVETARRWRGWYASLSRMT